MDVQDVDNFTIDRICMSYNIELNGIQARKVWRLRKMRVIYKKGQKLNRETNNLKENQQM